MTAFPRETDGYIQSNFLLGIAFFFLLLFTVIIVIITP